MKIGIDVSQLAYPGTGVAVYTQNLVQNLLKLDKENEYVFLFSSLRRPSPNFLRVKRLKMPPLFLEVLWNRLHVIPVERFAGKIDVFHTSDWLEPPARCPKVTTIHDLAIFKYPETFKSRGGHDIVNNLKRKFNLVKEESKLIIAVSENTKKDIVELLKIPGDRIRVVYEAAGEIFQKRNDAEIKKIKEKYEIGGNYILAVGTREPRKNLSRVIKSWNLIKEKLPDTELVIAGKFGWGSGLEVGSEKIGERGVKLLGYVPYEDLPGLYSGAQVFIYPSLYEGFGLPILEAMNCQCPVVTSNISSMPEIAGDSAILVNPEKVSEIAQGILKALKERKQLVERGLKRSKEFSWKKTAEETLKIYQEAYANRN